MLILDNLSFRWPGTDSYCLDRLSLHLQAGEQVALVGDNGAGKSTLLRLAAGLLNAEKGLITLAGNNLSEMKAPQRVEYIGILFQEAEKQIFHTKVRDEITFGLKHQRLSKEEIDRRTARALDLCQLTELADSHPLDLHAGQRRMVAVACLAALRPPLLLLDEPSRDFDAHWLSVFEHWLNETRSQGTTILTISHDLDFVARHFSRVIHLKNGAIAHDGSPSHVLLATELQEPGPLPAPMLNSLNHALGIDYPQTVEGWCEAWLSR